MRRLLVLAATMLFLTACGGGGGTHSLTDATAPQGAPALGDAGVVAAERLAESGSGVLGLYDAVLDFDKGKVALTPIEPAHQGSAAAIGDLFVPDISPYLTDSPCADCFSVKALSQDPDGNLLVDFGLRHPFPTTDKRRDLDVFDTRAIVIVEGWDAFLLSPKVHIDGDGVGDKTVQGNFRLLMNADGYTHHFDRKVEDTRYFNPPLDITGSVNPYIQFFTENDPDPTRHGFPLTNHRFSQTPVEDVQRFAFKMPQGQSSQLRVIIVLESSYGVSATYAKTKENPGQPGSRTSPVYFLPAFNQAEAYRVAPTLTGTFKDTDPSDKTLTVQIEVEDWQAGLTGAPTTYGDMTKPNEIPRTSDVLKVTGELTGLMNGVQELTLLGGEGNFTDPYRYEWTIRNEFGAPKGDYIGLISVSDTLDGSGFRLTASPGEVYYSFCSWQVVHVLVEEGQVGENNPPIAVADAAPNPVASGADIALIDHDSSDPDVGDSIATYAWDFDISNGRDYTDSVSATPDAAITQYINTGATPRQLTASLRVTDTNGAVDTADIIIQVQPPVAGNNPPVAVPEADPNPVASGETVALNDDQSFDPDAGDSIVLYEWDYDISDGRTYTDSVAANPNQASEVYTNATDEPVIYTASLRVTDTQGASDFEDIDITVDPEPTGGNRPPVAVAEAIETTVDSGQLVEFLDSNSYDPDPAPDKVVEYAWDYDLSNGATYTDSVSALPNRGKTTYTNTTDDPIQITASLRVKDTFGLTDTEDIVITVNASPQESCPEPLQAPTAFRMASWPTPPYDENPISLTWTAPPDPEGCLQGYAVFRSTRVGPDNTWKHMTDLDGDNQVDANEVITSTSWTETTWDDAGFPTTNKYYMYVVRTISEGPGGTLQSSLDSSKTFIYVNDFEGMAQLTGGTFRGTRSGFSWGLVNALAYPDLNAFNYGFEVATNLGNTGSHCLDESADIASGGYGPTNHSPYAAGSNFDDFIDDGYWNSFGPQLFTDLDQNPFTAATVREMQLFHKYQMETYFDPNQGVDVAADMGYVCVYPHADWEANRFNKLIDLPIIDGKGYDSAAPGVNPFLDQQYWPAGDRDPSKQIPKMDFLAGDFRVPGSGAPDWTRSVFDLTPVRNMVEPVLQFGFAGDEYPQVESHIGWSIDDILVVAY